MKLSINIILSELKAHFPEAALKKKHARDNELYLMRPHYYYGQQTFLSGHVYVLPGNEPPAFTGIEGSCLLVVAELPAVHLPRGISLITVGTGIDRDEIFNRVLYIFDKYADWDDALRKLLLESAGIEHYLQCSLPFIGNPMTLHDNNYRYLSRVGLQMMPDKNSYIREQKFIDPGFLLRIDEQVEESVFRSRAVITFCDESAGREFMFLNLYSGNTVAGRLVVSNYGHKFAPQDSTLAEYLGKYLEAALKYAALTGEDQNPRKVALLDFLGGKQHDTEQIKHLRTISPFGKLKEGQYLFCLAGICQNPDSSMQYAAYKLELELPESVTVLFDSMIVALCSNRPKQPKKDFYTEVETVLERYSIKAGCSNPFTVFYDLPNYFQQAKSALHFEESAPSNRALCFFKDYALRHFFKYGCTILPARLLCADCIARLAERDKHAAVSYCESLRIYLDTGGNSTETARRLNISRNTFLSRHERIMRYLDLDPEDSEDRLYLEISLRLIQEREEL